METHSIKQMSYLSDKTNLKTVSFGLSRTGKKLVIDVTINANQRIRLGCLQTILIKAAWESHQGCGCLEGNQALLISSRLDILDNTIRRGKTKAEV